MTERLEPKFYREMGLLIRRQILQNYGPESCIATTRATYAALRQLRVDAFPLSVQVTVVNRPVYQYAIDHDGDFPSIEDETYPENGYGVAITQHVVCIAERRWLLDYSIDQASRPEYGITLEPLVIPVEEPWIRGTRGHVVFRHGDAYLYYTARPGDRWFEESENWNGASRPGVELRQEISKNASKRRRLIR